MLPLDLRDERTGRREKERSRHESLNSFSEVVFRRILLHFVVFQHEYKLKNMLAVTASNNFGPLSLLQTRVGILLFLCFAYMDVSSILFF